MVGLRLRVLYALGKNHALHVHSPTVTSSEWQTIISSNYPRDSHPSPLSLISNVERKRIGYLVTLSTITTYQSMLLTRITGMYRTPDWNLTKNRKYTTKALASVEMTITASLILKFVTEQHLSGWRRRRNVGN
jgi:hypothetical protein